MMKRRTILSLAMLCLCLVVRAQDSVLTADSAMEVDSAASTRHGLIDKIKDYFEKANKPKPLDKFDFGIIGGPFYNKTAGFGIGLCASGIYHLQPSNPSLHQSNFSITGQITTKGMVRAMGRFLNFLPDDRFRSLCRVEFTSFKTQFWGLGFEDADNDDNATFYKRNQIFVTGNFLARLAPNLYLGPSVYHSLYYAVNRSEKADSLLGDNPHHTCTLGAGLDLCYDSRDNALNPTKGTYMNLEQRVMPEWLGNHSTFLSTELEVKAFTPLWQGGVLGGELHSLINWGHDVPWTEFARVGSIFRMRGYYEARYSDRNIIEGQVELRQHIKGRHGVVAWAGFANAFRNTDTWRFRHTLPNFGAGYRWRFKPGVNLRFDLGFSRNGLGFIFSVDEAF